MRRLLLPFLVLTASAVAEVTYSREISRIFQVKCQICHRPNDVAPFSLTTYEEVRERGVLIARAVQNRVMPPWKPVPGHGEFRDSYAITNEERQMILDWLEAGAPEGDPVELPEPLPERAEWELGEPDLIVGMAEPYAPPADRSDTYRCFVLPTELTERKHVSAVEVLPGNRRIVHHVLLFIDPTGASAWRDAAEEGQGYTCFGGPGVPLSIDSGLGGWVPGTRPRHAPEGVGITLARGARIIMQVHYHADSVEGREDEPAEDQTRIGIYFARHEVKKNLIFVPIVNMTFTVPPGAENYEVRAETGPILRFLEATAYLVAPHMHLLGREIKLDLHEPGGEVRPLIYIDNWDFNWQGFYLYEEPVKIRAGANIKLSCKFDNSENNPRNPNRPPKAVGWGEGTEDEMCLAFLGVTFDHL